METLVAVAHHRNHQYYVRNRGQRSGRLGSFGSLPTGNSGGINCRAFQSGAGLLPNPPKSCTTPTSVSKREHFSSVSPKTPSTSGNEDHKSSKKNSRSSVIPIPIKIKFDNNYGSFEGDINFSERWAGPAYSCSPPPSSLPMPKFSLRPKRAVSLDLHTAAPEFDLPPMAKSAPSSPTRGRSLSSGDLFDTADSATKTLRRILNLDITDK